MIVEKRAVMKRIATMLCSMSALICFGHAVGGAGGYLLGRGSPRAAVLGLAGGILFAYLALVIWKSYLRDIEITDAPSREDEPPPP
jgi:hypothetical protein